MEFLVPGRYVGVVAGELGGAGCQILRVEVLIPINIYLCHISSIGEWCVLLAQYDRLLMQIWLSPSNSTLAADVLGSNEQGRIFVCSNWCCLPLIGTFVYFGFMLT